MSVVLDRMRGCALGLALAGVVVALAPAERASAETLTKTANPTTFTGPGQTITYTYVVGNDNVFTYTGIEVTDSRLGAITCPSDTLAPAASMTCVASYTTTATDVTNGSITNTATLSTNNCEGECLTTPPVVVNYVNQPAWTLVKTPNPTTYTAAGQVVAYSYLLTNTGNVTIGSIAISDNKIALVSCPVNTLAPGASTTCTGNYTTTAADVAAGSVVNTATATGIPAQGSLAPVTAQATITFRAPPNGSITIVKTATGGNASFNFTSSFPGAGAFALATTGGTVSRIFSNLTPGTYTVAEVNLPLNWRLSALTCTGDTGGVSTTVDLAGRSVSIGLDGGEAITCTFVNVFDVEQHRLQTQAVIQNFLAHRVQLLATDEPDRNRFLRRFPGSLWGDDNGNGGGMLSFTGDSGLTSSRFAVSTSLTRIMQAHEDAEAKDDVQRLLAYAGPVKAPKRPVTQRNGLDVWVEAHFSSYKGSAGGPGALDSSGHFGVAYLGADFLLTPSVLLGALVQFDWAGENGKSGPLNSSVEGRGTMAGPYVSVRLAQNLFFDARAAWGVSDNKVTPFGTYEDRFATDRWLARANLTGNWWFENTRVTPSAGVTFVEEKQRGYTDTIGIAIPGQTVSLGRFDAGPEFAYRFLYTDGTSIEPHVSVKGVWDFRRPDLLTSVAGFTTGTDELRARVQGGVLARAANGASLRAVASYDGIGSSSLRVIGGQLWLNIPFR